MPGNKLKKISMDRSFKGEDQVHVYASPASKEELSTFKAVPYTHHGLDYYLYKDILYPGYVNHKTQLVEIFLSQPVPRTYGIYDYSKLK